MQSSPSTATHSGTAKEMELRGRERSLRRRAHGRWPIVLLVASLIIGGCSDFFGKPDPVPGNGPQTFVEPDLEAEPLVINIALSDEGFDPSTIFLPAGRRVKLVLRNRSDREHHYRVAGLIPAEMSWVLTPEIDTYDIDSFSPSDLEALGLGGDIDDIEHVLHHLTPVYVPYREESPSGIKPLANEVHGYVTRGQGDILDFFATNIGEFAVEDVLHPEITGKVVVFDPEAVSG